MKHRRIKIIISFCYLGFLLLKKFILRISGIEAGGRCTVIYYHSVKDEEKKQFARQMQLLKRTVHTLRADYTGKLRDGKSYVILTFDDGFRSLLKNALPELTRLEIPCAVFFPVKYLGRMPDWQYNKRFNDLDEEIMTEEEIKSLPRDYILVGSHSYSHRIMTGLSALEAREEFINSKERLEKLTGSTVDLFSFPYGAFNSHILSQAYEAGYKRVFTINNEVITSEVDRANLGRVRTDPSDTLLEFRLKILGAYEWLNSIGPLTKKLLLFRRKDNLQKQMPERLTA